MSLAIVGTICFLALVGSMFYGARRLKRDVADVFTTEMPR